MSHKQADGFKKTLRNMLRSQPVTNKGVAQRRKSAVECSTDKLADTLKKKDQNAGFGTKEAKNKRPR
jgi:hypothetical protein